MLVETRNFPEEIPHAERRPQLFIWLFLRSNHSRAKWLPITYKCDSGTTNKMPKAVTAEAERFPPYQILRKQDFL